jgi:organic radical activating enzyme
MTLPASGDRLLLSERFVSLQGEGVSTGAPAAFVRLGNCNLSCSYCDTPYTWDESRYDLGRELAPVDMAELAEWIAEEAPGRLIVTGGEPLLQHKLIGALLQEVDSLCSSKKRARIFVEVETNGTIQPSPALLERVDQWNVSPKLKCSGESEARRIKRDVLRSFAENERAYFKFVVETEDCVDEVEHWTSEFCLVRSRVQLMPQATHLSELNQRAQEVAAWALARKLRYSGRLHLELYGGKRGT